MKTNERDSRPAQGFSDKLTDAGKDATQRATGALAATVDTAHDKIDDITKTAKDVASHAAERVQGEVGAKQQAGADYIGQFADNIRSAAKAFETDAPFAARTISSAADYVGATADRVRNGSLGDIVDGAKTFARQQPAAFLGLSVLAGFALVRFLKASNDTPVAANQHAPATANQSASRSSS